jgi:two-component system, cell cycle sensor histidine kinase and response regulator CckA
VDQDALPTSSMVALLDQAPAIITIRKGPDHVLTYANPRYLDMVGHRDVLGRPGREALPEFVEQGFFDQLDQVYETGAAIDGTESEARVPTAEGGTETRYYNYVTQALRDDGGLVTGTMMIATDVTPMVLGRLRILQEQASVQEQMFQTQKLESLGLLAGGIAHDFNNLLMVILGKADLVANQLDDGSRERSRMEQVIATAQRAADLVRQLLAYSGKAQVQSEPVDLSVQVQEIVSLLEAGIPKKVELQLELESGLPTVLADPVQLQQVVMNLVMNAAEAIGPEGGQVRVVTRDEGLGKGRLVVLEVHDTGHGMDEATRQRIFDPFFTTKVTGRGLGMAAVLGIVRGHGGELELHTEPGRGTSFIVRLPAVSDQARDPVVVRAPRVSVGGLVLVVDDEPEVRQTARAMLEHLGYQVVDAGDGRSGVAAFATHMGSLSAVLLDLNMPGMNGVEVLQAITELGHEVPVMLSSGFTELELRRKQVGIEFAAFLQKPYTLDQLSVLVDRVVREGASVY